MLRKSFHARVGWGTALVWGEGKKVEWRVLRNDGEEVGMEGGAGLVCASWVSIDQIHEWKGGRMIGKADDCGKGG
jgi:hypothetical protein